MNNGSIVINTVYSFQINEIVNKQSNKEKQQKYAQRPEVKAKIKEYNQKPEVKVRKKKYAQRPEVKARRRENICKDLRWEQEGENVIKSYIKRIKKKWENMLKGLK